MFHQPVARARHGFDAEASGSLGELAKRGDCAVDHVVADEPPVPAEIHQTLASHHRAALAR